jgi:tripartite ATP-independent transporter DctP family solute receptor
MKGVFMKKTTVLAAGMMIALLSLGTFLAAGGSKEAAPSSGKVYELKLAHGVPETDPLHPACLKFKELIEAKSGGRIKVTIYTNSTLGDEAELPQALRSGSVEMATVYTGNVTSSAPSIGAIMLPYMYTTNEQAWKGMDAVLPELNKKLTKEAGIRVLGIYEKDFRVLTNSKKEVTKITDLQGLKIRVSPGTIPVETFKSFGITPISMAWAEVFTGLQQRVIDGQENPYTTIPSSKFQEVQKYVTEIHYMLWTGPLLISEKFFQSLPADLQKFMEEAGKESADWERTFHSGLIADAKTAIVKDGMVLSGPPSDEAEWQRRARAIWPALYESSGGKEWCEWVAKAVEEANKK